MFRINNKDTRITSMTSYFIPFFSVSIVDFEQVSVGWDYCYYGTSQYRHIFRTLSNIEDGT